MTEEFIASEERMSPLDRLPHQWAVTSDSLAAWVTATWPASRLVLLKSTDLPVCMTISEWVDCKFVDDYFPQLMPRLPRIEWVNLRIDATAPGAVVFNCFH